MNDRTVPANPVELVGDRRLIFGEMRIPDLVEAFQLMRADQFRGAFEGEDLVRRLETEDLGASPVGE